MRITISQLLLTTLVGFGSTLGCQLSSPTNGRLASYAPDAGHHDLWDAVFRRRHRDLKGPIAGDPMLELGRDVTILEDDIRRDGSITIKTPDVWGDANLVASIQEYESIMKKDLETSFKETLQAYIARSDQAEFQSVTSLAQGLNGAKASTTSSVEVINLETPELFDLLNRAVSSKPNVKGIGLEPTELDRQKSTFLHANQALRRRMLGDDNSRAAGYGLYLFRIPVSVIPGRETTEGYSAVATLRAQLQVNQTHLKNTFPRLVIADLVESLTPRVMVNWDPASKAVLEDLNKLIELSNPSDPSSNRVKEKIERQMQAVAQIARSSVSVPPAQVINTSQNDVFGEVAIMDLTKLVVQSKALDPNATARPQPQEIKEYLYDLFGATHNYLVENDIYQQQAEVIYQIESQVVRGKFGSLPLEYVQWKSAMCGYGLIDDYQLSSWFMAVQSGILDHNLKQILAEHEGLNSVQESSAAAAGVCFFTATNPEAVRLWEMIVRETFPLQVFTLDPIVEEQNASDAFSRRREMQLALAFNVANGTIFTADQKLRMSRALALDEATIALNRTAVGFAHGADTFGWYFHPRIQTPPTESTNLGALARTIWSTGPTEHYDRKHRRLEPGIRECEVLIAMPAFVNEVSFDVTTNWEKIARPGVTKRSYEEMLAQGSRVHRLKMCLQDPYNQECYRPGDYARLLSRVDQLEAMLGMQTYTVNLPFQFEQTGTGLFDAGKKQQRPVVDFYYGLTYLDPAQERADFFITGQNFHPTLTHVVVGGTEQHLSPAAEAGPTVEVISRELLRVRVGKLLSTHSHDDSFEVRVATPAGISNPLVIQKQKKPASTSVAVAAYDWRSGTKFTGYLCQQSTSQIGVHVNEMLFADFMVLKSNLRVATPRDGRLSFDVKVKFNSGVEKNLPPINNLKVTDLKIPNLNFINKLNDSIGHPTDGIFATEERVGVITCQGYFFPDDWSPAVLGSPITIELKAIDWCCPASGMGACPVVIVPAPTTP